MEQLKREEVHTTKRRASDAGSAMKGRGVRERKQEAHLAGENHFRRILEKMHVPHTDLAKDVLENGCLATLRHSTALFLRDDIKIKSGAKMHPGHDEN